MSSVRAAFIPPRVAQAEEIIRQAKTAAKIEKARKLNPAFDAQFREEERPVGFWQEAGYAYGWLRGRWKQAVALATLAYLCYVIFAPILRMVVEEPAVIVAVPLLFFFWLCKGPRYNNRRGCFQR